MKKVIDYAACEFQMGDLLRKNGVWPKRDFSERQIRKIRMKLVRYLATDGNKPLKINLKKFNLKIKGWDEAGFLLQYFS